MSRYTAARDLYSACFIALQRVLHHCLMVFLMPSPTAFVSVLSIYTVPYSIYIHSIYNKIALLCCIFHKA